MQSQAAHCWLHLAANSDPTVRLGVQFAVLVAYSFLRQALQPIGDTAPKASRLPATAVSPTKRSATPLHRPL
jgi:hypothetical protein